MTRYCCECDYSSIQIQLTTHLRNRLNQLNAPMGIRERQSRNLPTQKAYCSHWRISIDPLEKACYKWTSANSLLLNSPQPKKVESQNNL
ncbi:MAG: hypothetical protein QXQ94_03345 [Candidatus Bathyarchaeia archaeon]